MNDLGVGVELLFSGLIIVFLVLLLLMYVMKGLSALVAKLSPETPQVTSNPTQVIPDSSDDELAAVVAVVAQKLPKDHNFTVTIQAR